MSAFSITTSYLETRFNEFKRKYFYSAILMVAFKFSKTTRILGLYTHSTKSITITTAYDGKITSEEYDKILIHEMVHAYLDAINDTDTGAHKHHGAHFYREANRINLLTDNRYEISRTTKLGVPSIRKRICSDFYLLAGYYNGRYVVGKVSAPNIKRILKFMKEYLTEYKVYVPAKGDNFSDYTTSYRRFNYRFTEQTKVIPRLGECIMADGTWKQAI